jgi:hypothetical protein
VIRSAGERTTEWCLLKSKSIFPAENVFVINESPMHTAIAKTYEIGIDRGKRWTIELDADLLIDQKGLSQLLARAESLPDYFFFHYGMVFDKLSNSFRSAGHKILRTSYLPKALAFLPKAKNELRPDTYIRKAMAKSGYHYYRDVVLVGIHDFEQSIADFYRKGYLHGVKNKTKVARFITQWPNGWQNDPNYLAIKAGMEDGLQHTGQLVLSPSFFESKFDAWKESSSLSMEKKPLDLNIRQMEEYVTEIMDKKMIADFRRLMLRRKYHYHHRSDGKGYYKFMKLLDRYYNKIQTASGH